MNNTNRHEFVHYMLNDVKTAVIVSTTTTGAGLGSVLDWIPNDIGELATVTGIILSSVLIYTHWRKGRIEYEKTKLEIAILAHKERTRLDGIRRRKEESLPVRRIEDTDATDS